jgi:hypothetical protein
MAESLGGHPWAGIAKTSTTAIGSNGNTGVGIWKCQFCCPGRGQRRMHCSSVTSRRTSFSTAGTRRNVVTIASKVSAIRWHHRVRARNGCGFSVGHVHSEAAFGAGSEETSCCIFGRLDLSQSGHQLLGGLFLIGYFLLRRGEFWKSTANGSPTYYDMVTFSFTTGMKSCVGKRMPPWCE